MSITKVVIARKAGWCWAVFAHPGRINPGDRIQVLTAFPHDEVLGGYTDGKSPRQLRFCSFCLAQSEEYERWKAARIEARRATE